MVLSTPVAFIIFNRPKLTEIVFEAIAKAQPKQLLVIADGPRSSEEVDKCHQTRKIIERVDWDCEVLTNFSEQNLGCKKRVSSGLDWVFSTVEEAIILEDDCSPAPSFFSFCQTLLEKYRNDERIMTISGSNFQHSQYNPDYSYYFSKHINIWGWASWQRAWQYYDVELRNWAEYKKLDLLNSVCEDFFEKQYWIERLDAVIDGAIDTWDYQWSYACLCQNGLSIVPNFNLVSNIGFGTDATHTFADNPRANLPTQDIQTIHHPPFVIKNREADNYMFDNYFGGRSKRRRIGRLKQEIFELVKLCLTK
jgi:hypothetical protein